eukprot:4532210-Pyramimonas_sp.AAC.1
MVTTREKAIGLPAIGNQAQGTAPLAHSKKAYASITFLAHKLNHVPETQHLKHACISARRPAKTR